MKFLLDENVSPFFINKIKESFPESMDIFDIGFAGKSDLEIYEFLMHHEFVLITFDLDFSDIRKFPPELVPGLIVLRFKNKTIQDIIDTTLNYLAELVSLDFKKSLAIFQNGGIRIKQRLKETK